MKLFLLLLLSISLYAQNDYSFRVAYGKVTTSDLGEIFSGDIQSHKYNLDVLAFDGGYLLAKEYSELPLDIYVKGGFSIFGEDNVQDDIYETVIYIKAYWRFDTLKKSIRVGIGEGLSYTSDILISEYLEATQKEDNNSQLLNYLDISLDFDIGRLLSYKPLYDTTLGYAIKHRSGVFGLFNNVSHGGSNYNTLYIEQNF